MVQKRARSKFKGVAKADVEEATIIVNEISVSKRKPSRSREIAPPESACHASLRTSVEILNTHIFKSWVWHHTPIILTLRGGVETGGFLDSVPASQISEIFCLKK